MLTENQNPRISNSAISFFHNQFRNLEKNVDIKNFQDFLKIKHSNEGYKTIISLQKNDTNIIVKMYVEYNPFFEMREKNYFETRLNPDSFHTLSDFSKQYLDLELKMDLISTTGNVYAYPYYPFIWKYVNMTHNLVTSYDLKNYIQNTVLFHNECTNNIKKNKNYHYRRIDLDIMDFYNSVQFETIISTQIKYK